MILKKQQNREFNLLTANIIKNSARPNLKYKLIARDKISNKEYFVRYPNFDVEKQIPVDYETDVMVIESIDKKEGLKSRVWKKYYKISTRAFTC